MGSNMDVDGILVNDTDMRGYSCQVIGDLECDDGEMPACSGRTWTNFVCRYLTLHCCPKRFGSD